MRYSVQTIFPVDVIIFFLFMDSPYEVILKVLLKLLLVYHFKFEKKIFPGSC